jgi:Zn-dependent protease with chaperone function
MDTPAFVYPPAPLQRSENMIKPNGAYRAEVFKVAAAILFFLITYLSIVTVGAALSAFCVYAGFILFISFAHMITIMIGLGLIGLGVMVLFFLLKFIVARNKSDRSGLIELTKEEQPELFEFVKKLTEETKAPFPKRIYLSADVNACVFYDSSFWSMLFPVKKNLQIGMGLVNSVNLSEFKAILGHEFGHFSQSSMKLGSYVYNVNKIIFNMLYDNEGYGNALQSWARASSYFAIFANITVGIVNGIQAVLKEVYAVVNKQHMSLSRQMEFHADAVSAYVSGSDHLISSLRRIEMADFCYHQVLGCYNQYIVDNLKSDNFYPQHIEVLLHYAHHHDIPLEGGLPMATAKHSAGTGKGKLVLKDQWASHPSTDDREAHLKPFDVHTETVHTSAWSVFRNAENLQKEMTALLYSSVVFKGTPQVLTNEEFSLRYRKEVNTWLIDKRYKGFYDAREISVFSPEQEILNASAIPSFEEVFTDLRAAIPADIRAMEKEYEIVSQISKGKTDIKLFEYNGKRYRFDDSVLVGVEIKTEIAKAQAKLKEADIEVFRYSYARALTKGKGTELLCKYAALFTGMHEIQVCQKKLGALEEEMKPFFQKNTFAVIQSVQEKIKTKEQELRPLMSTLLQESDSENWITEHQRKHIEKYLEKDWLYFFQPHFNQEALAVLQAALSAYGHIQAKRLFLLRKNLVEEQIDYLLG